jgi:hypothetical protein
MLGDSHLGGRIRVGGEGKGGEYRRGAFYTCMNMEH